MPNTAFESRIVSIPLIVLGSGPIDLLEAAVAA